MIHFTCEQCGKCCKEYSFANGEALKRIPVFPEELDVLENFAIQHDIHVKFLEDVVFPDLVNNRILVITYKIMLDNDEQKCPFSDSTNMCTVNHVKPLACKAFPVARKKVDAYHETIEIDPYCCFVEHHEEMIKILDQNEIQEAFQDESVHSRMLMSKNQSIILRLKQLAAEGRLEIPEAIDPEVLSHHLATWEREYLSDFP